jgi:hypothetical protein
MKTKGEAIKFKLEFMLMMLQAGRDVEVERAFKEALEICDTVTEPMPEEAE